MSDKFMHVIDGKAVSKYDLGCVFVHSNQLTGQAILCELMSLHETSGDLVLVQYFGSTDTPVIVKCRDLHWYKKPNFTVEDLIK